MGLILFIAVISVSFFNVQPASAATITIQPSYYYNTTSVSINDQIQTLIDSAKDGDTLNFIGKYYENLSLIIKRSLNLITNVNTTVTGDTSGQPVFLVTGSGSRWTNITGFKIKSTYDGISVKNTSNVTVSKNTVTSTNGTGIKVSESNGVTVKKNTVASSHTGISATNTKNSNISSNKVKNSVSNGVEIQKSHSVEVSNNNITSNGKHGVSIASSDHVAVDGNDIGYNNNNGVNLVSTNQVNINNNTMGYNNLNGIYFDTNVKNTQITSNVINYNSLSGIELYGSGSYTKINGNKIDWNPLGIDVNSKTDYLDIGQNVISNSKFFDDCTNGVGINIGAGYQNSPTFSVSNNAIFGSGKWEIWAGDSVADDVNIGYNWYGSSDPSQVRVCRKVAKNLNNVEGFGSNGEYSAVFFAGNQFANLLQGFDVKIQLNNGPIHTETVKNGTATTKFSSKEYLAKGNYVTITVGKQPPIIISIPDEDLKTILEQLREDESKGNNGGSEDNGKGNGGNSNTDGNGNNGGSEDNGNGGTDENSNDPENNGQNNNGNPGDNPSQSSSAPSSGSSGSPKLERTSAQVDGAGEAVQSTSIQNHESDQSKTAQELLFDNVNNPNLWSIVAFILLIATIVVFYYRHEIMSIYRK